jgi:dTDP-L-rhamnose 4-epimerase
VVSAPRTLVVGGAGFIGSFVVDALVEAGYPVRVLDHLHPLAHDGKPDYRNPGAEYIWGDVRDHDTARAAVAGVDLVSHQAAMVGLGVDFADAPDYVQHNSLGTAVLLRALHETGFQGRLVLASSMVIYGEGRYRCAEHGLVQPGPRPLERLQAGRFDPLCWRCGASLVPEPVPEDAPPDPRNVYAATKLNQEHLCFAFARSAGIPAIALRYHNVYGPRMPRETPYAGVASIFRSSLAAGRAPRVFEDGAQRRDFVHVRDVALANLAALRAPADVEGAFNIASGAPRTVGEMAAELSAASGGPAPETTGEFRRGDVRHVFASAQRATEVLGFSARIGFGDGMREFALTGQRPPPSLAHERMSRAQTMRPANS